MNGRQHLLLEYFANDLEDRGGIPLVFLTRDMEANCAPHLRCLRLIARDGYVDLSPAVHEYLDALLRDVWEAAESPEAAYLLFVRLEGSSFGPIRSRRVDEPINSRLLSHYALRAIIPTTPWEE
jgi:hypothetical protein